MVTTNESFRRFALEERQREQDQLKEKATFEHRRTYVIGQMTIEEMHDVPGFVKTKDGTWVIRLSQFENYVKALSDRASSHRFLASSSPPESVVKELRKDLKELAMHNNGYMGSAAPYNRVVAQEDQISKFTDKRHLVQRQKYLVGKIMLYYFPELPPFTGGTNDEYRSKLVRYKQLLKLIFTSKKQMMRAALRTIIDKEKLQ